MQATVRTLLAARSGEERRCLLADPSSVPAAFTSGADPRRRQGRRYALPYLVPGLLLALLSDCHTLEAVGPWCQAQRAFLAPYCPAQRFQTPTGSLVRRLVPRLSAPQGEEAIAAGVRASRSQPDHEPLACDGKAVRGAATAEQAAPPLLSVSTHHSQATLLQVRVADKTNAIPVAQAVLPTLPLPGSGGS